MVLAGVVLVEPPPPPPQALRPARVNAAAAARQRVGRVGFMVILLKIALRALVMATVMSLCGYCEFLPETFMCDIEHSGPLLHLLHMSSPGNKKAPGEGALGGCEKPLRRT
jgi:hypothetical protein